MKKIITLALCAVMSFSLVGCSSQLSNEYIVIKQYKGLEIPQVKVPEVTDEDVDMVINNNLNASKITTAITDRPAKDGDSVYIDYEGKLDGVAFEGGTGSTSAEYPLVLGSGSFIGASGDYKGFEEQIVGHSPGDTFDITVKFPDDYYSPDLAGKVAVFTIKLNSISEVTIPELTDEWVQENSETAKTVAEYRKEIRKQHEENNKKMVNNQLQNEVMTALMEQIEVKKFPDGAIDKEVETFTGFYKNMAAAYQMEFKDFLEQMMNMTEDVFDQQVRENAENSVKRRLASELIAKKRNLEPSEKEYQEEIARYAKEGGFESPEAYIEQYGEDLIRTSILQIKVAEFLVKHSVQVEATDAATAK